MPNHTDPLPTSPLDLPLSPEVRRKVLFEWNATAAPYPRHLSVPDLFQEQAARRPHDLAVVFGHQHLTYAALQRQASLLAAHLRRHNLQAGEPVALAMPRSAEMVLGMLAILMAGGAYLPLDLSYPTERLRFMLEDSQARLLLSVGQSAEHLAAPSLTILRIDQPLPDLPFSPTAVSPEQMAYLMYTSGSTGRPKGACIPHRGIVRLVCGTDYINIQPGDRLTQASNMSFDAATFEVWGALLNGACLVGVPPETAIDPAALAAFVKQQRIDHLFLTTALFVQVAAIQPDAFNTLQTVMTGGEAVPLEPVRQVLAAGGPQRLLNMYGPTETTTYATWYPIRQLPPEAATVPIGRPIANSTAYVLDPQQQPAGIGVPGELYLGGDGLALGYWRRPELTAERFVDVSLEPGAAPIRLYRTGDRVRWLEDGSLEFLGRLDQQIKLRGFRIELGEIEAAALEHPLVQEAAAILRHDPGVGDRLALYVAPAHQDNQWLGDLRQALAASLPAYMLPAIIEALPRLPISPNGKVDRLLLAQRPAPSTAAPALQPPSGPLEQLLAGVWQETLNLPVLDRQADFFLLGGHSLLAVRLVAQVNDLLDLNLPVRLLLENPTLADFAGALRAAASLPDLEAHAALVLDLLTLSDGEAEQRLSQLDGAAPPDDIADEFPLSHIQAGMLYSMASEPHAAHYFVQWVADLHEDVDAPLLWQAWEELIAHHAIQRASFHLAEMCQRVHHTVTPLRYEADLSELPPDEQERHFAAWLASDRRTPLDVAHAPAFRLALFRLSQTHYRLVRSTSHLIYDGRSSVLIYRELFARYDALRQAVAFNPAPSPSYHTYVDWLEAEARKAARPDSPVPSFWRQWLHGLTVTPPLPYDRGPAPVLTDPLLPERHSLRLSQAETSLLNAAAQSWGVTLNTLVQAAWALTAARLTGQTSVVFGAARACRKTVPDAEWMLGPLVNTLPLRVDLDPSRSLSDLLHDLRQRWLDLRPMEWASHNDIRHWAGLPASVQLYETVLNFNGASFTAQAQSFVSGSDHRFFQYRQSLDMPLALHAFADPEMLFWLEHDPRRISSSDGHSLLESWVSTLQSLASHPASSLRTWLS